MVRWKKWKDDEVFRARYRKNKENVGEKIENNVEFKKEVKTLEQAVRQCG